MKSSNDQQITRESLKDKVHSSYTHSVDSFASELKEYKKEDDYTIPDRYFINNIVLLPVNFDTGFFYWEVTKDFIISKCDKEIQTFVVQIREENESSGFQTFDIYGEKGSYYFNTDKINKKIYAVLGVYDIDGKFIELLRSNVVKMPSDYIIESDNTTWLTNLENWNELLDASIEKREIGSSEILIKESENIKKIRKLKMQLEGKLGLNNISSGEFAGSSQMSSFTLGQKGGK